MDRRLFVQLSTFAVLDAAAQSEEKRPLSASQPASITTADRFKLYSMMGRGEARLLVTGEQSQQAFFLGDFREFPGFVTQLHRHPHTDEQFYVLEGVLSMYMDGSWHDFTPGTPGYRSARHSARPRESHQRNRAIYRSGESCGIRKTVPSS
jgi:quercetin dioxygenase-like cupin family protein